MVNLSWLAFQVHALSQIVDGKGHDTLGLVDVVCTAVADEVNCDRGLVYASAVDVARGRVEVHQAAGVIAAGAYSDDGIQPTLRRQPSLFRLPPPARGER